MDMNFVARQPIIDKNNSTYGYELLFRNSEKNFFPDVDGDYATANLIVQNHFVNDIKSLCNDKQGFINFNENAILSGYPEFFEKEDIVIEVLETVTFSDAVQAALSNYVKKGFTLSLDDVDIESIDNIANVLPYISILKVDVLQFPLARIAIFAKKIRQSYPKIKLLAERVETHEQHIQLQTLGFTLFQGYFFSKPEVVKNNSLSPVTINLLRLIGEVFKPNVNFNDISDIVSADVKLTVALLKIVNSASNGLKVEISTMKQAVTFLGEEKIKLFVSILTISKLAKNSFDELITTSIIIAKKMELLAIKLKQPEHASKAFLTGMLSCIDAILKNDLSTILKSLPLPSEINQALNQQQGFLGELLTFAQAIDHGERKIVLDYCQKNLLKVSEISKVRIEAHQWFAGLSSAL